MPSSSFLSGVKHVLQPNRFHQHIGKSKCIYNEDQKASIQADKRWPQNHGAMMLEV
jgi:hypothetical protein